MIAGLRIDLIDKRLNDGRVRSNAASVHVFTTRVANDSHAPGMIEIWPVGGVGWRKVGDGREERGARWDLHPGLYPGTNGRGLAVGHNGVGEVSEALHVTLKEVHPKESHLGVHLLADLVLVLAVVVHEGTNVWEHEPLIELVGRNKCREILVVNRRHGIMREQGAHDLFIESMGRFGVHGESESGEPVDSDQDLARFDVLNHDAQKILVNQVQVFNVCGQNSSKHLRILTHTLSANVVNVSGNKEGHRIGDLFFGIHAAENNI